MNDTDLATLRTLRDRILDAASRPGAEDEADSPAWRLLTDLHAVLGDIVKRHDPDPIARTPNAKWLEGTLGVRVPSRGAPFPEHDRPGVSIAGREVSADELAAQGLEAVVVGYDADDRPIYGVARVERQP